MTQIEVRAPYDRQLIRAVEASGAKAVEAVLATAYRLLRDRDARLPPAARAMVLREAARRMQEQAADLARESGKPLVDSRVEVARAIDGVLHCAELLRSEVGQVVPMGLNGASAGRIAFTQHEPIGVVVSAFNHPLNLLVHQVAPAIATGCPVIVKPATDTPLFCLRFFSILHEAGLPPGWCQALVIASRALSQQLVTDARVGFFSFIVSAAVGWSLRSSLTPGMRCALEHGGAAPALVLRRLQKIRVASGCGLLTIGAISTACIFRLRRCTSARILQQTLVSTVLDAIGARVSCEFGAAKSKLVTFC